jgi:photosystem II stability/assembly factor-like uncharacterized protein
MKRALLICPVCLVPLLALGAAAPAWAFLPTSDGAWVWQNPLPQGNDLFCVSSSDVTHGWAVGDSGTVVTTSDGGLTWTTQSSGTTADLGAVAFVDATHGWVVGSYGAVLATNSGGYPTKAPTAFLPLESAAALACAALAGLVCWRRRADRRRAAMRLLLPL